MSKYVGAIDQGTTSSRFIVFDRKGQIVSVAQKEHEQIYPKPGWVEHNAKEIWESTKFVIAEALRKQGLGAELCLNLGDGVNQAANLASSTTSIPSRNLAPLTIFGNWF